MVKQLIPTDADQQALKAMPDGWFSVYDRWSSSVTRPQYRIDRLCAAGALKSRSVGEYPNHSTEYRKVKEPTNEQ